MDSTPGPYLSVVVTTRNDDHGGNPLARFQAFITTLNAQWGRFGGDLGLEVVVVDWNPPPDRPRLRDLLRRPEPCHLTLRFVEVPPELHQRLRHAAELPLFQMIGKNVGIRRARGRFVLSTNIDIILSNELVEFLTSGRLEPGYLYRVDRHDIESAYPIDDPLDAQMAYCAGHQLRVNRRSGTHPVDPTGRDIAYEQDVMAAPAIAIGDGWHVREGEAARGFYRWVSERARLFVDRTADPGLARGAVLALDVEPNPHQPDSWVDLEILDGDRPLLRRRLTQRGTLMLALDDDVSRHEIALRVHDVAPGGRAWLPLFERRDGLVYRIRSARMVSVPTVAGARYDYDMAQWRRADPKGTASVDRTSTGIAVATDPRNHSYAVSCGPFQPRTSGTYAFALHYTCTEGGLAFTVLDGAREQWVPSTSIEVEEHGVRTATQSVDLKRGQKFWLYVSNRRTHDHGVSRFVLHGLRASVPPEALRPAADPVAIARWVRGRSSRLAAAVAHRAKRATRRVATRALDAAGPPARPIADARPAINPAIAALDPFLKEHRPPNVHQNASGDFQLMARDDWFDLRGYPEFHMYSMNIDGLLGDAAHQAGIKEYAFTAPLCAYHLEHEAGWTPEGEATLRRRIAERGIAWLEYSTEYIWAAYMQSLGRPMIFNGADWGFGHDVLPDTLEPSSIPNS